MWNKHPNLFIVITYVWVGGFWQRSLLPLKERQKFKSNQLKEGRVRETLLVKNKDWIFIETWLKYSQFSKDEDQKVNEIELYFLPESKQRVQCWTEQCACKFKVIWTTDDTVPSLLLQSRIILHPGVIHK